MGKRNLIPGHHLPAFVGGSPGFGVGIYPAVCALGLEGEARGLRGTGVSSRKNRPLGSAVCVHEGRCAGLRLLSCRVSDTDRNE